MYRGAFLVFFLLSFSHQNLFANFNSPTDLEKFKARMLPPLAGAHQGGLYDGGPNTLEQFEKARQDGIDIVEMDLRLTKDNVVVVYHDEDMGRFSRCKGLVQDKTWDEIQKCPYINGKSIPSFEDVLKWSQGRVVINAEFKVSQVIQPAIELVHKYNANSWVYFQCSYDEYHLARSLDHQLPLLLRLHTPQDLQRGLQIQDSALVIFEIDEKLRTKENIALMHTSGRLVSEDSWHMSHSWELFGATCDKIFKMGMDIAITNRPKGCVLQKKPTDL